MFLVARVILIDFKGTNVEGNIDNDGLYSLVGVAIRGEKNKAALTLVFTFSMF